MLIVKTLSFTSNDGRNTDTSALELHREINAFRRRSSNEKYDPRRVIEYICKWNYGIVPKLSTPSIEKDVLNKFVMNKIIQEFAAIKTRKIKTI